MNDATVIAVIILVGMFLVLIVTILKSGVDAALRLWSGMGALTGVALGSIITFYFTNQAFTEERDRTNTEISERVAGISEGLKEAQETVLTLPGVAVDQEIEMSEQDLRHNLLGTLESTLEDLEAIQRFKRKRGDISRKLTTRSGTEPWLGPG